MDAQNNFKIFGHRGYSGLYPENTIEGFKKAIETKIDGIEWDIVVNKNLELIISHEPFIDLNYCQKFDETKVSNKRSNDLNIFQMTKEEIKSFDCGSKINKKFPNQKKQKATKPTLKELENELKAYKGTVLFEIKHHQRYIGKYYPKTKKYAEIIYEHVIKSPLLNQYIFMSFDSEILNELNKLLPKSKMVFLINNPFKTYKKIRKEIFFCPFALGIDQNIITKKIIQKAKKDNILTYVWTVNSINQKNKLIKLGVDGIITDYPDILVKS